MNVEEDAMIKLEPRCLCCLSEIMEKFSTENMTRVVQDLMHGELPHLFKYVPLVFCVDCVAALEQYQKLKSTVERSFVTLEKLVVEKGLNKNDYLEQLEILPKDAVIMETKAAKPVKILWKCPGRPRKDGTAAQPRFLKIKAARRTSPVYDSDSYKSNSSEENFCRRSDNEEWNPDNKNVNFNKREKKYKTKQNNVSKIGGGSGKRGRPRKIIVIDDTTKENKTEPTKPKIPNGILVKSSSEHLNGNHTKIFVKRPRGRPPKTEISLDSTILPITPIENNELTKPLLDPRIISSNNDIQGIKKRGRPRKNDILKTPNAALKITQIVNKRIKVRTKPMKSIIINKTKKRGRPKKSTVALLVGGGGALANNKKPTIEVTRKRKRKQDLDKSVGWATETEAEEDVKRERSESDDDDMTEDLEVNKSKKYFILAS